MLPSDKAFEPARQPKARVARDAGCGCHFQEKYNETRLLRISRAATEQREQNDCIGDDANRAGERESAEIQAAHQQPINRKTQERGQRADDGGRNRIARGVEAARQNILGAPGE